MLLMLLIAALARYARRPASLAALLAAGAVAGSLALVPATAFAADDTARAAALAQFQRAAGGDKDAIEPAATQWLALSAADPADPAARAYAGAAVAMRAQTTVLPWRKMSHAEDGLAMIDKALAQLMPAHEAAGPGGVSPALQVRFTAANTFLKLPGLFHRGERGERLLAEVLKSPQLAAAPAGFQAAVWMLAGRQAADAGRKDEARQWWQKVATSGAPQAVAAQAQLEGL